MKSKSRKINKMKQVKTKKKPIGTKSAKNTAAARMKARLGRA